jgi:hypothetical protein
MNNTKNDKYLRKNRHGKNSKYKNKTRKVQRGGEPGNTAVARGIRELEAPPSDTTINEIRDAQLKQKADDENKRQQESNPELVALAKSPSNIFKSFFLNLFENKKKQLPTAMTLDNFTKNISTIIDENDKNLDIINKVGDAIREHIKDILNKENSSDLTDDDRRILIVLLGELARVGEIAQNIANSSSQLAYAATTDGKLNHGPVQPPRKSVDTSEKPSITQRFKQGFSNMRKTVKNAATSAKGAVTSRFSRKKNVNEDSQGIELQGLKNSNQEESTSTEPTSTESTSTEPTSTDSTEENKTGNNEKSKTEPAASATTEPAPLEPPKTEPAATTASATPEPISQSGGNKTRKNRQYVREIKENRTHLFNKEMEIINSIRNFKHGRTDNTKKQFIKAVKRG